MKNEVTILLQGVVGSTVYGLATPDSDVDRLGMYAEPTTAFHGLHIPIDKKATRTTTKPDMAMHEARKFARLALAGNPTVTELLWLPERFYEVRHPLGNELIEMRDAFLCARQVKDAYLGYAFQQFDRLSNKSKFPDVPVNRIEKHARHLMRLMEQFLGLWTTGELQIEVSEPERFHEFGRQVADGDIKAAKHKLDYAEGVAREAPTVLPEHTDEARVEAWLQKVRRQLWDIERGAAALDRWAEEQQAISDEQTYAEQSDAYRHSTTG